MLISFLLNPPDSHPTLRIHLFKPLAARQPGRPQPAHALPQIDPAQIRFRHQRPEGIRAGRDPAGVLPPLAYLRVVNWIGREAVEHRRHHRPASRIGEQPPAAVHAAVDVILPVGRVDEEPRILRRVLFDPVQRLEVVFGHQHRHRIHDV